MDLFKSTFLIRPENFAKAAKTVCDAGFVPYIKSDATDRTVLNCVLNDIGLHAYGLHSLDTNGCTIYNVDPFPAEETVDFMEQVFKAISKSVEPGTYIEFKDGESLIRYAFFWDTVERWTVPYILYTRKEAIL